MKRHGSSASGPRRPRLAGWRRGARGWVLGLSVLAGGCGLAQAAGAGVARAVPSAQAASAPAVGAHPAHDALHRWGLRLVALGVGAGVGWALLRLGRSAGPGSTHPVDGRLFEPGLSRGLSTARPLPRRSDSRPRAR